MQDQLLPTAIPIATAAILAGLSRDTFRARCLNTGLIAQDADHKILVWSLAAWLGEPISLEKLLEADRRREPARRAQRRYRKERVQ
jgi:hypothetical protein